MIGRPSRLRENNYLPPWRAYNHKEKAAMFFFNVRAQITRVISAHFKKTSRAELCAIRCAV